MYDRKTWLVLIICSGLLALNLYYSGQNKKAAAEKAAQEKEQVDDNTTYLKEATGKTDAELTVETPPPPTEEALIELGNDKVTFTLSNIGGGIKYAEFANEYQVGSETEKVRSNRFGRGPIGAITDPSQQLVNVPYTYKADQSEPGKTAVYIAKLPSGMVAKKTYSLVGGDKPGAPYLLDYKLQLENAATGPMSIGDWGIFLGEASPLYPKEHVPQTGFFWREGNDIEFRSSNGKGGLKTGWFRSTDSFLDSPSDEEITFAGVTNQFFTTVIHPKEATTTSAWGKARQVKIFDGEKLSGSVRAGLRLPDNQLKPGESISLEYHIFIGPKQNTMLRDMEEHWGEGWGDVMQYGWFWFISRPLNWLLNIYHDWIDNVSTAWSWGLAIIILTITVRIFIWPLHAKSTRTMKRMGKLKPEMEKLREKYKDDPNKLNMETMGLYRKYGINPLGGCLPMLLQIPIFFGF